METIRYLCISEQPVDVGHILVDEHGTRFQTTQADDDNFGNSPMHNSLGRIRLVSMKDIADSD